MWMITSVNYKFIQIDLFYHQIISASHFQCLSAVHPPSQLLISHLITLKVIIKVCVTICFTPTLPLAIQVMTLNIYAWHTIEHLLFSAMQLFIPVSKIHSDQHPMWFDSDIRHCKNVLEHFVVGTNAILYTSYFKYH